MNVSIVKTTVFKGEKSFSNKTEISAVQSRAVSSFFYIIGMETSVSVNIILIGRSNYPLKG